MPDELHGARFFSMIDLSGYHHFQIHSRDEWKTTIKAKYGSYEGLIMPFGHQMLQIHVIATIHVGVQTSSLDKIFVYSANLKFFIFYFLNDTNLNVHLHHLRHSDVLKAKVSILNEGEESGFGEILVTFLCTSLMYIYMSKRKSTISVRNPY